jgi:hypothetical protein
MGACTIRFARATLANQRTGSKSMIGCHKKVIIGYIQSCMILLGEMEKSTPQPIITLTFPLNNKQALSVSGTCICVLHQNLS